jgi:pimeloyl-ACP methyl ester carboxylesterase
MAAPEIPRFTDYSEGIAGADRDFESLVTAFGLRPGASSGETERLTLTRGKAKIAGAEVPYTIASAAPLEDTTVDIITPGFGGTQTAYTPLGHSLALSGGAAAATFKPRRHQGLHSFYLSNLIHPEALLPETIVGIMNDMYQRHGVRSVNLKGHSMGGPAVVAAAEMANKAKGGPRVDEVTLLDAAGATRHNLVSLAPGAAELTVEMLHAVGKHPGLLADALIHNMLNPLRTVGEMLEAGSCRLDPNRLAKLGELGIKTGALYHVNDPLFPGKLAKAELDGAVDVFSLSEHGGHLTPITHPNEVAYDLLTMRSLHAQRLPRRDDRSTLTS